MVQLTIACVTLYLHRGQAHRGITYHPIVEHFMRAWLWLTTGMVTAEWVAIHRRHHQRSDTDGDPHSPQVYGIWTVLFKGAGLYHRASKDRDLIKRLSIGTPTDWIERKIYSAHSKLGVTLMALINLAVFGWWGLVVWMIQMIWIPVWAAGVINGLGHWCGYRNTNTNDTSTNLIPWAVWVGGEELHNNHHADGANPCFRKRWWEIDIGWIYIKVLILFGLAKIRVNDSVKTI